MNPLLPRLQPYPFERLKQLQASVAAPAPSLSPISLDIGEPRHVTPALIKKALNAHLNSLSNYPNTRGGLALRQACVDWVRRRYGLALDKERQILPITGSREALFAIAQVIVDSSKKDATVVCPNPFYQIYEGATLLAGATPWFVPSDPRRNFAIDWVEVPETIWQKTQLVYICSPANPTGTVIPLGEWQKLFALSDKYGFVIASDECYSEIYCSDTPPLGSLQAAHQLGRKDYRNLLMFTSLSKRSNAPGLRSGFVAGSSKLIEAFFNYRTYHGSAMGGPIQAASIAAWGDEAHVEENRALYRQKFKHITPLLQKVLEVMTPEAGFYLWAKIPKSIYGGSDTAFAAQLYSQQNVIVLPGSYLARTHNTYNPGQGYVRMALVASLAECIEAAQRIVRFCTANAPASDSNDYIPPKLDKTGKAS